MTDLGLNKSAELLTNGRCALLPRLYIYAKTERVKRVL